MKDFVLMGKKEAMVYYKPSPREQALIDRLRVVEQENERLRGEVTKWVNLTLANIAASEQKTLQMLLTLGPPDMDSLRRLDLLKKTD